MTKRHAGDAITITATFTNEDGDAADPSVVTFAWRMGRDGAERQETPVSPSVGHYTVQVTPEQSGNLYGCFRGYGAIAKTIPVHVPVFPARTPAG